MDGAGSVAGHRRNRAAVVFGVAGLVMAPWIVVLAVTLPATYPAQHWNVAWIGLDVLSGAALIATAGLLWRGDHRAGLASAAAATALVVDAWFDVTTASAPDLLLPVVQAGLVELPLAALCVVAALRQAQQVGVRAGC